MPQKKVNSAKKKVEKSKESKKDKVEIKKIFNVGHRKRLRERTLRSSESLEDYELLELLLFATSPRKDTKDIAKRILAELGDIPTAIHTDPQILRGLYHFSEPVISVLLVLKEICVRSAKNILTKKELLNESQIVSNYVKSKIGFESREVLMALFLDKGYKLISDEIVSRGTTDFISVYPKEITSKALLSNASYVILAHNHPSGSINPSEDDIYMTKKVIESLKSVEIKLVDHIIVSKTNNLSFRGNLIIDSCGCFNNDFDLSKVKETGIVEEKKPTKEEQEAIDRVENLYKSIMKKTKKESKSKVKVKKSKKK